MRPDETDEQILKLFVALIMQHDPGMLGQVNQTLHITKGRYVAVDQHGEVSVKTSGEEIKKLWKLQ